MALYDTSPPELGSISIKFPNVFLQGGVPLEFQKFISYEYTQDFLTPSDRWSFTIDQDEISEVELIAITPRTRVEAWIDGQRQMVGYVDDISVHAARGSGTVMTIEGRDWLSPAVDCHVDPKSRFKTTMTIEQVVQEVFAPFGINAIADDNTANRNAITGAIYGTRTSKKGKPLKNVIAHELKPYPNEGAFEFASRVTQRAGLWIWPAADGQTVVVGQPDFDQDVRYQLRHTLGDNGIHNNVEMSDVKFSGKDQPSVIIATGFGGGGVYAKSSLKAGIFNPAVDIDNEARSEIVDAYPEIKFLSLPASTAVFTPYTEPGARPLFLYDAESHNQAELESYVYRQLSLLLRKSFASHYTIEGHKLNGQPIAIDTVIDVDDDRSNVHDACWVLGRHFMKNSGQPTKSTLELIRRGSLIFGPTH